MINAQFLSAVATASSMPSAVVQFRGAEATRSFALEGGYIVESQSTAPAEGLIALLASEGRFGSTLVGPLGAEVTRRAILPEYLLLENKLLEPAGVVGALERMVTLQFRAAMLGKGQAATAAGTAIVRRGIRLYAGALILDQFRGLSVEEIRHYLGGAAGTLRFHAEASALVGLRLQPAELRVVLSSSCVNLAEASDLRILRLGGALVALGLATCAP